MFLAWTQTTAPTTQLSLVTAAPGKYRIRPCGKTHSPADFVSPLADMTRTISRNRMT